VNGISLSGRFFVFIYHRFYHPVCDWTGCAGTSLDIPAWKMEQRHRQDPVPYLRF